MAVIQVSSADAKRLTGNARDAATQAALLLREKAGPQLIAAKEWVSPRAQVAWRKGLTAASPKVAEAAALITPRIDDARDALVERALPAIVAAVDQAARKAAETGQPAKQKRCGRKVFLWAVLTGLAGALAYWLWRKTQPASDPWAEDELEALAQTSEENLTNAAHSAADAVGEAAGVATKKVTAAAKKTADAAKKVAMSLKAEAGTAEVPEDSKADTPDS